MVRIKEENHILPDGSIDLEAWLERIATLQHYDVEQLRSACLLSQLAGQDQATDSGSSCLQQGLAMAEILIDLEMDQTTITSAIIYNSVHYAELTIEDVAEQLGEPIAKLVKGVQRMEAVGHIRNMASISDNRQQLDNIRKMLLAIVDDARVALVKLAERLTILRAAAQLNNTIRQQLARETMQIYAPLANRLGVGHIKWELEDLAFRYLEPEKYKSIAKALKDRRVDRDKYVVYIVETLQREIAKEKIKNTKVYGRAKHIHGINRKMQRKNIDLDQIYDASAIRVLVDTIEDCYAVLSIVHHLWKQVKKEFDDYISNPKENGYQSLHTAVVGPNDKTFEVQIRTYHMHELAELGVAAHWKYKEDKMTIKTAHERKISWLRDVLSWHKELATADGVPETIETEFLEERIYVFTPEGDIIDLPNGATPLDFAYHVHSEIGHRCRGAKVNNKIVPLTYALKTGEQIEVLTGKNGSPSRDWISPHLGYLKSSRAKAKVLHWFKHQDQQKNSEAGQAILERECRKLNLKPINQDKLATRLHFKKAEDLFAALGRGDIRISQVIAKLAPEEHALNKRETEIEREVSTKPISASSTDIQLDGTSNLLTHIAQCCQPIPGDAIIGYITLGRGISIHRQDCSHITNASSSSQQNRLIPLEWGQQTTCRYIVDIYMEAHEHENLRRDISTLVSNEQGHITAISTSPDKGDTVQLHVGIAIQNITILSNLLDKLKQLPGVIEAKREGN